MRPFLLPLFVVTLLNISRAQDFVPNADFNIFNKEKTAATIDDVKHWGSPGASSPDLKTNESGGHVGFYLFHQHSNMREYIQVRLNMPLLDTCRYVMHMEMKLMKKSRYAIPSVQALFSGKKPRQEKRSVIEAYPQGNFTSELLTIKTGEWFVLKDTFEISGGERYLTIGNFYNDMFTEAVEFDGKNDVNDLNAAVYFIDNIKLTTTPFPPGPPELIYAIDSSYTPLLDTNKYIYAVKRKKDTLSLSADSPEANEDKLGKAKVGEKVVFNNIRFEFNSSSLLSSSYPVLNKVASVMKKKKILEILVVGHTDDIGNKEINMQLSRERAEAVVRYLVDAGVEKERLSSEGKGSMQPIAGNETEQGRELNRRVEFMVLQR